MLNLETSIQYLKGVGPKMAPRLAKLGLEKVEDLLFYFPRRWDDLSQITPIKNLRIGNVYNIKAKIISIENQRSFKRRINITSALVEDQSSNPAVGESNTYKVSYLKLKLIWFNQPFLIRNLKPGQIWIFSGKVEWDFQGQSKIMVSPTYEQEAKIFPVYAETEGITSKYLRRLVKNILQQNILPSEFLPEEIKKEDKLFDLTQALKEIHFPSNQQNLQAAKKRLAFEELFLIILGMLNSKKELELQTAPALKIDKNSLQKLVKSLPYQLTNAQRKAAWEIVQDLTKKKPMNRLLEGDVGSGKTIVACLAVLTCIRNNHQVVWMAPTEILARQHFQSVSNLLKPFDIKIGLLTSSSSKFIEVRSKKLVSSIKSKILNTKFQILASDLIIGTHALIQEGVKFPNLGLVIIDEQHRFGVKQRAALQRRSTLIINPAQINADTIRDNPCRNPRQSAQVVPHFLSMTATPIPRTLALSLYGDLDISIIDEMPPGRQRIITRLIDPTDREKAYQFIRDQIKASQQVFVICPLIETKEQRNRETKNLFELDRKSVKKEYEKLSKEIFPHLNIAMLHGKMKSKEKEKIMADFKDKKLDLLVSTSVIEVGIDIANATVMMIEDADRFGLAQLHQFRGRVGRGAKQSYCLMFTSSLSPETNRRLKALVECSDGFKLAEKDLEIRGPGQLSGLTQHGFPDLKMASLTDIILIKQARSAAEAIIERGLEKYPLLIKKLREFELIRHLE